MKVLVGLSNNSYMSESKDYKMYVVDVDEIIKDKHIMVEWEELDINKLQECANIRININNFKSIEQNPNEYIEAGFDINRLIGWERQQEDFQVTNIYYDESNKPQLYRSVSSSGYVSMHDISEFDYKSHYSILGKTVEELPPFVRRDPLSKAYEWWKEKEEAGKNLKNKFLSGHFEVSESTPVKLLYHYLTGVKGFKAGFHTVTEINDDYSQAMQHEYMLFKDTATIKLIDKIPKNDDKHSSYLFSSLDVFGQSKDSYPTEREFAYNSPNLSAICTKENYPTFDIYQSPSFQGSYDKDGIAIAIDSREGLISIYNKLEEAKCISKEWRLNEYNGFFGMSQYTLIPEELVLLSSRLQREKEDVIYGGGMKDTRGYWSTNNIDGWIKSVSLLVSMQYYSNELKEELIPIINNYYFLYKKELCEMIENMGPNNALETMKWTKDNLQKIMSYISTVKPDGTLQKSDTAIVDQISNLFTFNRNDYDLPEWLQIYSKETIETLGGTDFLKDTIAIKGEEDSKKIITVLAEGIESEIKDKKRQQGEKYILEEDLIIGEKENIENLEDSKGIKI